MKIKRKKRRKSKQNVTYKIASSFWDSHTGHTQTFECDTNCARIFCTRCASYCDAYQSSMYPSSEKTKHISNTFLLTQKQQTPTQYPTIFNQICKHKLKSQNPRRPKFCIENEQLVSILVFNEKTLTMCDSTESLLS